MPSQTRTNCKPGQAEVLMVDYMSFLWNRYEGIVPEGRKYLLVADIHAAKQAMASNPYVQIVVVQGMSRYNVEIESDDFGNSAHFLQWLRDTHHFEGRAFVVSTMWADPLSKLFELILTNGRARAMEKSAFFTQGTKLLAQYLSSRRATQALWDEWERFTASKIYLQLGTGEGPESVLTWLEDFDGKIRTGTPEQIYHHFIQLPTLANENCWCDLDDQPKGWEIWLHHKHGLANEALWELIAAKPDLMAQLRRQLEDDLAAPSRFIGSDPRPFGLMVEKSFGRRLRTFLQDNGPRPEWTRTLS